MVVGAVTGKAVHNKWSDKKMEGKEKEGFNTIECLRARLLAERHASKLANDEAQSLALKLIELENKLSQEIKSRERAERRLKFWERKLKPINISSTSGESEQSYSSSEKCESSFTANSSASTDAEENETKPHSTNCPQDLQENPSPNSEKLNNSERRVSFPSSKSSTSPSSSNDEKNDEIRHGI